MMSSRTSARQQRMRQQTLNEERMTQPHASPRSSTERRSSGCSLIYSSPTPSCLPTSLQTSSIGDRILGSNTGQSRAFGTSALLASLNGSSNASSHIVPMESCFANIVEDQGSDSFDLNNITPSISIPANENMSGDLLGCATESYSSTVDERSIGSLSTSVGEPYPNIRMDHGDVTLYNERLPKPGEVDFAITQSTSCPAEMRDPLLLQFETSPLHQQAVPPSTETSNGNSFSVPPITSSSKFIVESAVGPTSSLGGGGVNLLHSSGSPQIFRHTEPQRAAWMRDRSKKDSHNRIERKRRDYINCQITELGNLLPDEMFRDGECKKNKGTILKNSVEFIMMLRSELTSFSEVRKETVLAANLITHLVKYVQELENVIHSLPSHAQLHVEKPDYQRLLQDYMMLHERNQSRISNASTSPNFRPLIQPTDYPGSSSPGLSSIGTDDMLSVENKSVISSPSAVVGSAPAPGGPLSNVSCLSSPTSCTGPYNSRPSAVTSSPLRLIRTRCTSLTVTGSTSTQSDIPGVHFGGTDATQQSRLIGQTVSTAPMHRIVHPPPHHTSPPGHLLTGISVQTQQPSQAAIRSSQTKQVQQELPMQPQQQKQMLFGQIPTSSQPHFQPRHSALSKTLGASTDSDRTFGLSTSLPVRANPLLGKLTDRNHFGGVNTQFSQPYSFELEECVVKSEPSENDPHPCEGNYMKPSTLGRNTYSGDARNIPVQFDPLLVSAVHLQPDNFSGGRISNVYDPSGKHTGAVEPRCSSGMVMESPLGIPFESDDFQFDDVPME